MSMTPAFSDLNYFLEVARTHNISRAAERLGITQPSLSSAMKRLEDSFGVDLLIRSRSGVQLTHAGLELQAKSKLLLQHWEMLKGEVSRRNHTLTGSYTIGCHTSVALYSLPGFLPDLVNQYADLEVKLVHDLSRKITEGVISFEIDFGIVVNPVRHPDLKIIELCTDEVGFWTTAGFSDRASDENAALICDPELIQVQSLLEMAHKRKISFRRVIHSSSLEVVAELTASGAGLGVLPGRVAARARTELCLLGKHLPVFKDRICLVFRADAQKSAASRIIIDSIRAAFR